MEIKVQKLSKYARMPSKSNQSDAGWDLYAAEDAIVEPSQTELIGLSFCQFSQKSPNTSPYLRAFGFANVFSCDRVCHRSRLFSSLPDTHPFSSEFQLEARNYPTLRYECITKHTKKIEFYIQRTTSGNF